VSVTAQPEAPPEQAPERDSTLLRIAGLAVAVAATVVTAVAELYLTPLRLGGAPIGVAVLFAGLANWAIAWFAETTTQRRWSVGPPWALWTLAMLIAAGVRTTEGDYLLSGDDWIALVMILVGSLAFAVYAYRMILRRPAVVPHPATPADLRDTPAVDR
jgi:drug/metabolite transporter (DMT)-like permease